MSDQAPEQSLEERMLNVLDAEDVEEVEELAEEVEVVEEETTEEVEETEEEDEESQPQTTVRLKLNGEEIEKPLDEVISLAQQGLDYTQKTQKVADERRSLEEYAQTIQVQEQQFQANVQAQQALIQDIAQITATDNQINAFQNVDWAALSDNDPVEAQKLFFQYNQLQTKRGQMANELGQKQQQMEQAKQQHIGQLIQQGKEVLSRDIPGWNENMAKEILSSGKDYGYTDLELNSLLDPRAVKVLHDAAQWRKLQANPALKQKISQAKPIVKPGAKDAKQQVNSNTRAMREQLRKTGDSALAAKLIEQMI